MKQELDALDATAQAELVRSGEAKPVELVEAAIERIERVNPQLNAVIHERFDKARAAAAGELPDGPFKGVPFLMKDLGHAELGDPLHNGMQLLKNAGFVAPFESHLVEKLRAAGFVCVGRTNTPELGGAGTTEPAAYGATHNPWDPTRSPGGSSGGSGAAVAARLTPAAHANDAGGSIRIPASCNGIVGLKPTRARVSAGPMIGENPGGFVCEGTVTLTVRDTAAILDAIAGPMPGDPYTAPPPVRPFADEVGHEPGRLRIGLMPVRPGGGAVDPECATAVEETGRLLESLGHDVETAHPPAYDEPGLLDPFEVLFSSTLAAMAPMLGVLAAGRPATPDDFEPYTAWLLRRGASVDLTGFLTTLAIMQSWSRRVAEWWAGGFDVLVTPTLAEVPPPLGQLGGSREDPQRVWERNLEAIPFTPLANMTGQPALSLPLHWSPEGLPVGVHFVADTAREDLLIRLGAQLEAARPWIDRRPPICA